MLDWIFFAETSGAQIVRFIIVIALFYLISLFLVWTCAIGLCRIDWWDDSKNVYVKAYTGWAITFTIYIIIVSMFLNFYLIPWLKNNGQSIWGGIWVLIPLIITGITTLSLIKSARNKINQELLIERR
jgi:amino acid transporter